jgi:hypothetical protein
MRVLPTAVDPVNDTFRSRASSRSGPTVRLDEDVVTMLSTPGGSPASSMMRPSASMLSGVSPAGFMTIVHPAATAGPILRVPIARGKFQGVMRRHGPTGWRMVSIRPLPSGAGAYVPATRGASSANHRKNSAA